MLTKREIERALIEYKSPSNIKEYKTALYQTYILIMSAFENYAYDRFIYTLNKYPKALKKYLNKKKNRREELMVINLEEVVESNFNLKGCLGDIIMNKKSYRFNDLHKCEEVFKTYFGIEIFKTRYSPDKIIRIKENRNIIVHNNSKIDKDYKAITKSRLPINSILKISKIDVVEDLKRMGGFVNAVEQKFIKLKYK